MDRKRSTVRKKRIRCKMRNMIRRLPLAVIRKCKRKSTGRKKKDRRVDRRGRNARRMRTRRWSRSPPRRKGAR